MSSSAQRWDVNDETRGTCDVPLKRGFSNAVLRNRVHREKFATDDVACMKALSLIELFYTRKQPHASLGYVSPVEFTAMNAG